MTNPPFGTDIKIEDSDALDGFRDGVAQPWTRNRETGEVGATIGARVSGVSPEQLFIQRAVDWVRPGGRVGIVLPNGILSNPGPVDHAIRRWILERCWVLASVELPVETFVVEQVTVRERVIRKGQEVIETSPRSQTVVDDDLPEIAQVYRRFRSRHPEPGTRQ